MNFVKVENKDHKFGEAPYYYYLKVGGKEYLFTLRQLVVARERAKKNREDIKEHGFWDWVEEVFFRIN